MIQIEVRGMECLTTENVARLQPGNILHHFPTGESFVVCYTDGKDIILASRTIRVANHQEWFFNGHQMEPSMLSDMVRGNTIKSFLGDEYMITTERPVMTATRVVRIKVLSAWGQFSEHKILDKTK